MDSYSHMYHFGSIFTVKIILLYPLNGSKCIMTYLKTTRKFYALLTRMRINTQKSIFLSISHTKHCEIKFNIPVLVDAHPFHPSTKYLNNDVCIFCITYIINHHYTHYLIPLPATKPT